MIKDMTVGNPSKILLFFSLPMIAGNILQQLYSIIDSMIVGNFVGADALAAVGASYPITFVLITIANGCGIGCGVIISQYFGGKFIDKVKTSIFTSIIFITLFSLLIMVLGVIFYSNILSLINTPKDIFEQSCIYMKIYFWGVVFLFVYNIINSSFNALGNSKTPLLFLILSSFLNIILDLLFVIKFQMGVAGAAYATFMCQIISAVLSLLFLLKSIKNMHYKEKIIFFDLSILKNMFKIVIPSILQQSIVSIGNLFVQALVNSYGIIVIAGYAAAIKIDSITILPMVNMSNAVSTFTGQNIGANKPERIKNGYKGALIIIGGFCAFTAITLFLFGHKLIGLFVNSSSNSSVIDIGVQYMKIVSLFYFFMGLMVITNGILRGSGDMKIFLLSTLTNLSTRIIFAYTLAFLIGQSAIWWAIPCGWILASTISVIRYKSGKWKSKSVI
ncbi:MATE family efflux transporter [Clostridium sp. SM-530-WT-3G]|uniref:MATE family efflux transporter n=1 Tax=Clostridium sp. SM-530-WT-3G TaxID=2725303 RepID=UPI00145CE68B|nr:MATE family efflux transporter [Clostridium sp. SM-530-WT-3G]NME83991.1 MATE family efflux transporter [Clostridium sp. SM-530-WT-3G]